MAAEGMDIPHLDTLILASPRTDIEQSVGRILRKKVEDRTVKPIIVDIVDKFSVFINQGKKRNTYYKKNKYKIVFEDYYADECDKSKISNQNHFKYDNDNDNDNDSEESKMRSLLNKLKFGKCIIKN